ncbi:MAG TPA: aldo/keto reductase [Phycisphaerae bacterium]|nr:aldo/keto reductase [Phycisphaerae bacterium]
MTGENDLTVSRRDFVKASLTAAAFAATAKAIQPEQKEEEEEGEEKELKKEDLVPTRPLGKTGVKVSILNLGTTRKPSKRMLNAMYAAGIRYIDTAASYVNGQVEPLLAEWMAKAGNRKEFFIVTKDGGKTPEEWAGKVDDRLKALKTDYIDLFFIHGVGGGSRGGEPDTAQVNWPKDKEWKAAAGKLKKSGKVKFTGFSTHTGFPVRADLLKNAAEGGWVDALMTAYDPLTVKENADFNKALDACHKAGVGLISMKQMRGAKEAPKFLPDFEKMGLNTYTATLHAVWTDERIASICNDIPSIEILKENVAAAKKFKPLDKKQMAAVIGVLERTGKRFCNACDGSCRRAAGTKAALNDIVRYLSYYEMDGCREEARRLFAALSPEERDWHLADLAAAAHACHSKLDFATLLARAEEKLA